MQRYYLAMMMIPMLAGSFGAAALEPGGPVGPVTFESLDGFTRTMDNYGERAGTVVVFLSARCPVTAEQIQEVSRIYEAFRFRDILFVGIAPNSAETGDELRTFAQHNGLRFPIYRDPDGAAAAQFGASVTPEFFLLDKEGALVYHGGLGAGADAGLEAAVTALSAGESIPAEPAQAEGTAIGAALPPRDIPDPYGSMTFYSGLIFTSIPGVPAHHCSTITEAANGDLLCLWYAGSYESADDQALYLARLEKGRRSWNEPERVLVNHEYPPGNAVIFQDPAGNVRIIWGRMEGSRPVRRGAGWSECRLFERISTDNGHTWSEDRELPGTYGWLPRNAPLTLNDGTFALPISGRVGDRSGSFLLVLNEDGQTWERRGFIQGGSQPTVIQRANGELLALMRSRPRILESVSADNGHTWTPAAPTDIKNPGSGIAMTRLDSGRVVLAFNDTDQSDRTPFNLLQSYDDGRTWEDLRTLEADWGEFSYPCIIQGSDGMAHLTYTYRRYSMKHTAFDEGWLTHLERPN